MSRLYVWTDEEAYADPSTYNVFGLTDGNSGENWGETSITWNGAPANDISSNTGVTADATFLGAFTLANLGTTPQIVSFTSDALVNFLLSDTDDLVTLIVSRQDQNYSVEGFAAKESTSNPAPSLTFNVPEPATLALMGLGLAGIGYSQRRRKKAT